MFSIFCLHTYVRFGGRRFAGLSSSVLRARGCGVVVLGLCFVHTCVRDIVDHSKNIMNGAKKTTECKLCGHKEMEELM